LGEVATQTYQYEWLVGEQPTEVKAATVPAKLTEPGQVWTVRVRAFDGVNLGPPGQATVPIGNLAPELAKVAIAPANPTVADTLVCDMPQAATDADGQKLLFQFSWTVNGQPFAPGADKGALQLATLPQPGVLGGAKVKVPLKAGDVVACSVLVTDGIAVVGPVDSAAVKLGAHDGCGVAFFPCGLGATCTPTDTAAVVCTCKTGLAGDGTVCADVDECTTGKNACDPAADCTNTFGGYTCGCPSGYSGDGWKCSDLDECALGTHACSLQADCANVVGGYDCNCKPGYVGDGQTCTDVDACKLELLICDPHATCVNLPGTDTCTCDLGWAATETNGTASCVDLNECATATACVEGAICTNFQGGYDCTCGPGWQGDGKTCTNIDECKQGTFVCAVEATCQDMMGDYLCVCGKGWIGDGKTCDDVDECANGSNQCDPKALCTNKPGGYDCACKEGLAGDGKTCKAEVK
jgi:hypothetical protein